MSEFPPIDLSGDYHVHTKLCNHASGEMEDYVQAAIQKGLCSLTFLEHLECGLRYEQQLWLTPELFTLYFQEGERLRTKYAEQIRIQLGVEIGWNGAAVDEIFAILAQFPFEHRGLSCHFYFDGTRHLNLLSSRQEHIKALQALQPDKILETYFASLQQACEVIPCDKLCHLDAALRHLPNIYLTSRHQEQIKELFLIMQPYPAVELIQQAAALGLALLPGSDAHHPSQVGRFFDQLR